MKAVHVVPRIHEQASGPTYSATSLCDSLARLGVNISLHVTHSAGQNPENYSITEHGSYRASGPLCVSPAMKRSLHKEMRTADIVHNHSLWMMPNIYPGTIVRPPDCKLICSPRGTMSDWAWNRSRWKKRMAILLGQQKMLKNCDCFHATSKEEVTDIRRRGFSQPIAFIPNGVDCVAVETKNIEAIPKTLLFLARLHPVKGLDLLLDAWMQLFETFPEWTLKIAGPIDSDYAKSMQQRGENLPKVQFLGNVVGAEKEKLWAKVDLYVLPTHSENFGLSIAEALAHGVPAIVCEGAPWQGLITNNAGWWVPQDLNRVIGALREGMSASHEQRVAMGSQGRNWMTRDFSWPVIAQQMLETYRWLAGKSTRPDWVTL